MVEHLCTIFWAQDSVQKGQKKGEMKEGEGRDEDGGRNKRFSIHNASEISDSPKSFFVVVFCCCFCFLVCGFVLFLFLSF